MQADWTNLVDVLTLIKMGLLGPTVSILLGKLAWYNALKSKAAKVALVVGLVIGLPVLAQALLEFVPADVWAVIQPWYFTIVNALLIAFPTSQAWYLLFVKPQQTKTDPLTVEGSALQAQAEIERIRTQRQISDKLGQQIAQK